MNGELKARWLEALRGGDYNQGRDCLRSRTEVFETDAEVVTADHFDALGVLLDLMVPDAWCFRTDGVTVVDFYHDGRYYTATPPEDLAVAAGLLPSDVNKLAWMSDRGYSFGEIADWVEASL